MYLEIGLLILVIILIILFIFCIPILLQAWRILKDVRVTLETLNQSLPMILKNMEEIAANVNSSTAVINQNVQNFSNAANRSQLIISNIIDNVQSFVPMVMKLPIFKKIRSVAAVIKGIRVFIDVLLNKEKV